MEKSVEKMSSRNYADVYIEFYFKFVDVENIHVHGLQCILLKLPAESKKKRESV